MSLKMQPCPNCGAEPELEYSNYCRYEGLQVACPNCYMQGPEVTDKGKSISYADHRDLAIAVWNHIRLEDGE